MVYVISVSELLASIRMILSPFSFYPICLLFSLSVARGKRIKDRRKETMIPFNIFLGFNNYSVVLNIFLYQ